MSSSLFEVNSRHVIGVWWELQTLCMLKLTCGVCIPIDHVYMDKFTVTIFAPSEPQWSCEADCDLCEEKKEHT